MPSNNSVASITMLIGVNGVTNSSNIIKDTKELINKLIDRYPDKKIYIQRVLSVAFVNYSGLQLLLDTFKSKLFSMIVMKYNIKYHLLYIE